MKYKISLSSSVLKKSFKNRKSFYERRPRPRHKVLPSLKLRLIKSMLPSLIKVSLRARHKLAMKKRRRQRRRATAKTLRIPSRLKANYKVLTKV